MVASPVRFREAIGSRRGAGVAGACVATVGLPVAAAPQAVARPPARASAPARSRAERVILRRPEGTDGNAGRIISLVSSTHRALMGAIIEGPRTPVNRRPRACRPVEGADESP